MTLKVKSLMRLTVALALWEGSAALRAVSVTLGGAGRICGAVKSPVSIVPQAAPLQPDPATLQFTAVLLELLTVAVNSCVTPSLTEAVGGEMLTLRVDGGAGGGGGAAPPPAPPPLHPIAPAPAAMITHRKIT